MKHVHYDKIVAKAVNFELIQFVKIGDNWEIVGSHDNKVVSFASHYEYFLCLPHHKEACLHWLNGGKVEYFIRSKNKWGIVESIEDAIESECERLECLPQGEDMKHFNPTEWSKESIFMRDDFKLRIKPKKEKRLIAIHPETSDIFVATSAYIAHDGFQLIEIEVEV